MACYGLSDTKCRRALQPLQMLYAARFHRFHRVQDHGHGPVNCFESISSGRVGERWRIMRTLVNMVAVLTALLGLGVLLYFGWHNAERELGISSTQRSLDRIRQEIARRASMDDVMRSTSGWPMSIDPKWFDEGAPRNSLLACAGRAWMEIASDEENFLNDPAVRASDASDMHRAEFWYNPATGVVRARVKMELSDRDSLDAYNRINNTHLETIFDCVRAPVHQVARAAQ